MLLSENEDLTTSILWFDFFVVLFTFKVTFLYHQKKMDNMKFLFLKKSRIYT